VSSFLRSLIRLEEIDSTSTYARRIVAEPGLALPLLVRADRQTAGRGRAGRAWWSDEGSLTFTLILDPARHGLRLEHEPRLALTAALSLIEALEVEPLTSRLGIRWPNDVEAADRKLAGLLPERVETAEGPRLLLGVGINVTSELRNAPELIRGLATSARELGVTRNADDLLQGFLDRFASLLEALSTDDPVLTQRWNEYDTLRDRLVRLALTEDRIVRGTGQGIDERGGLRLEVAGVIQTHYGGQVLRDREPQS
jgi:BirA family biotin operon repressor/biotin-[acetyl-CoA-carboxylase] ligase